MNLSILIRSLRAPFGKRFLGGLLLGLAVAATSGFAQSYSENFDDGLAQDWTVVTGTWLVSNGSYDNYPSYADSHPMAIYNPATGGTWSTGYSYSLSVYNDFGSSGNNVGVLFNYVDSTHYQELLLNPVGTATLRTANGSYPVVVATAPGLSGVVRRSFYNVTITRTGTTVSVVAGGSQAFDHVGLADLGAGHIGASTTFDHIRLDNVVVSPLAPDTTPPTVTMTAPADGSNVHGVAVTVSANASDDTGVAGVQFQLDGSNLGAEVTAPPYAITWDSTGASNGTHTLTAVARDAAGNTATAAPVTVTVANAVVSYSENFDDGLAQDWVVLAGTWLVSNGAWDNYPSYALSHSMSIYSPASGGTWNTDYSYSLSVYNDFGGTGNDGGILFNYVDATHYHELLLNPTGTAVLRTANGGNPLTVATATGISTVVHKSWFNVMITRVGTTVSITAGGTPVLSNVSIANLGAGHIGASATFDHTKIDNVVVTTLPPDTTPPTVAITAPSNGATVFGNAVPVSATASDDVGVTGVQFQLDGSNLGPQLTSPPYALTWDSTAVVNGSHSLTAVAHDAGGNSTTSAPVAVTVSNSSVTYGEDFSDGLAQNWTAVTGTWTVTGGVYDNTAQTTHDVTLYTGTLWDTDYTYSLSMWNGLSGVDNDVGAAFNYVDATHYQEVIFTPTGTAMLRTANGGAPTVVATATGLSTPAGAWFNVQVIRSGPAVTVKVGGSTVFDSVALPTAARGEVGLVSISTQAQFDNITVTPNSTNVPPPPSSIAGVYGENFDDGVAQSWTATGGAWSVAGGIYYNLSTSTDTSLYTGGAWSTDYIVRVSLRSGSTGASAQVGLVYNYVDANNYYTLLLAADGSAQLLKTVGGAQAVVQSAPANSYPGYYTGTGNNPWVDVELTRTGTGTTVRANGARIFFDVAQTELGAGQIGLTDSGTTASFDNVSVTSVPRVAYSEDLSGGAAQNWSALGGNWDVTGGYYETTSGDVHDLAVYGAGAWNTDYTYSVSAASALPGPDNKLGAVYNYVDANNYYEVLLGGTGTAEIRQVVGGVVTSQGAASYVGGGANVWSEIRILRSGTTTTVNVNGRRVFTNIVQDALGAGQIGVAASADPMARFDNFSVTTGLDPYKKTFPKIAGTWIGSPQVWDSATYQQLLAKEDFAVISIYRSWHGGGLAGHNALQGIKALNPTLIIANYADAMEAGATGDVVEPEVYTKLGAEAGPVGGTPLPNDWWARNNSGEVVSESASRQTWMTNLSYYVQPDTNGYRFAQWYANWQFTNVYSQTPEYDIAYEDNFLMTPPIFDISPSDPDWNRDGINDAPSSPLASTAYRQGSAGYLMKLAQLRPGTLIMGNVGGEFVYTSDGSGHPLETPEYQYLLNSALYEAITGQIYSDEWGVGFTKALDGYHNLVLNTRTPNLVIAMTRGTLNGLSNYAAGQPNYGGGAPYAFMRYSLALVLMDNGYISYNLADYSITHGVGWFDEFDLNLGEPEDAPQTAPWQNGVYFRRFQNGAALVNPRTDPDGTPRSAVTLDLTGMGYKHFLGTQDPVTNNGQVVTTLTLQPGDGIILIKQGVANRPPAANAGPDQTVEATNATATPVMLDASASSDPDGNTLGYTWSWTGGSATGVQPHVTLPVGTTVVTLTVDDGFGGVATATVNINVVDTTPPAISAPADITTDATGPAGAVVTFTATATDLVSGTVSVTATPASGSVFPVGTTAVALSATDAAGNTATAGFNVTVVAHPPAITLQSGAQTATVGDTVSFNVSATGTPTLTYQWQKNGINLGGATASTLTLANITTADAGAYAVIVSNSFGTATSDPATLTVHKATATVALTDLNYFYDGTPKAATVTTIPAGLTVDVTYNGNSTPPIYPGSYAVVATVNDANYQGSTTGTLVIGITGLIRHAPTLNGRVEGSLQVLLGENFTINGGASVTGDVLVPGTPVVQLNGSPVYGGTVDGPGNANPANYQVTLNGNAALRHVVRRIDPLVLPAVSAPPAPAGTRDVVLDNPGQSVGDFTTVRNLTLNGNVGQVSVPPGAYGSFIANGNSGFTLGIPGAAEPAVYNLQQLTLNGGSRLEIVGPVLLTLANGVTLNGAAGASDHPDWLTLQIASGGLIINGGAGFDGVVVAPNGAITINGNSQLIGVVVGDRLIINGNGLLRQTPQ